MNGNLVTIIKDGEIISIDEDSLSLADMVVLQAGELVPADLKLLEARGLEVDEFDITGEIMPVIKKVDDNDVITYVVYMLKDNERINVTYNKDGKFIKKNSPGKRPNLKKDNPKPEEVKK